MNALRPPATADTIEAELAQIAAAMRAEPPDRDLEQLVARRRAELGIEPSENRTGPRVR